MLGGETQNHGTAAPTSQLGSERDRNLQVGYRARAPCFSLRNCAQEYTRLHFRQALSCATEYRRASPMTPQHIARPRTELAGTEGLSHCWSAVWRPPLREGLTVAGSHSCPRLLAGTSSPCSRLSWRCRTRLRTSYCYLRAGARERYHSCTAAI